MVSQKKTLLLLPPVCIVVLSVILIFSYCTSPFYHEPSAGDSAMFMLIGKYWSEGFLPYVSFWDSKGPIIFFINAIGNFKLFGISGIFIIQVIALLISAWLMLRWLSHEIRSKILSVFAVCVVILSMCMIYNGGNTVEEYLTPLLVFAFYLVFKWTRSVEIGRFEHSAKYAFVYGLVFAFSLWSRLTNAVGIGMAVLFIVGWLMCKGLWKNLLANAVAFISGFVLLSLPIIIYFHSEGILDEMWYGTFLYNLDYAATSDSSASSLRDLAGIIGKFGNAIILLFTAVIMLFCSKKRRVFSLMWMMVACGTLYWLMKGNGYGHYAIIALPYPCISLVELYLLYKEHQKVVFKHIGIVVSTLYALLVVAGIFHGAKLINLYKNNEQLATFREIVKQLPEDYKKSFLAYNCPPDIYIYENIKPACRFFTMQDWEVHCSSTLEPKMNVALEESKPEWIVLGGAGSQRILDFLGRNYQIYGKAVEKYTIYQLQCK